MLEGLHADPALPGGFWHAFFEDVWQTPDRPFVQKKLGRLNGFCVLFALIGFTEACFHVLPRFPLRVLAAGRCCGQRGIALSTPLRR